MLFSSFFHRTEADVLELRRRYNNLYVPSDFFFSQIRWSESFPPHAPFSLQKPCTFHVFHKSVANPNAHENHAELDPPDADSTFSAKVYSALLNANCLETKFNFIL